MFNSRDFIGLTFDVAKSTLENMGFIVREIENTGDDKHNFDTKLVVRVDVDDNIVTLITAKFLMNI